MFKLNPVTPWDHILGTGIPPKENILGKTGVGLKVLLPQSRSEPQMKGISEVRRGEFNDGKGGLCLRLVSVRQVADASLPSLQTQPCCRSGNGRKPRPTPGNWLLE